METPMSPASSSETVGLLDELIEATSRDSGLQRSIVQEHLESARIYLTSAMPLEYQLSMSQLNQGLDNIENPALRSRLQRFVQSQMTSA